MFGLLLENLKLYKMQYLYITITTILLMFIMIEFEFYQDWVMQFMIIILIFIPETIRQNMITNNGYLKLLNKLPISYNDLYRHKLLVSSSGMILIILLLIAINLFEKLPLDFFKTINLLTSNLFAFIILQNSTNIFNSPHKFDRINYNFINIAIYFILFFIYMAIFEVTSELKINILGNSDNSVNYLLCLFVQIIFLYYFGKLYYYFKRKKTPQSI